MRFLHPIGLLGLIGVPILVLIYILRSKYNEQTIASTYLWTLSEKFFKRRNPLSGLTGIISLILQILTVIFVSLAIARPVFVVPESANEYCFILDCSGSMQMTDNGDKTRFELAKEKITSVINEAGGGSSYTLVTANAESGAVYERLTDKKLALELLSSVECSDGMIEEGDALAVAQKYYDENRSFVTYFLTDKAYSEHNGIELVNFARDDAVNYSVTDARGTLFGGLLNVTASVTSHTTDATLTAELYINGSDKPADSLEIAVSAGQTAEVELSAAAESYDSFSVVIANPDDLSADNRVVSYNQKSESSYDILVVSETPFFFEAALDVLTDSKVDVIEPDEYNGQVGYGLYIFHTFTPEELPDAAVWLINSSKSVPDSGFGIRGVVELDEPAAIVKSNSTASAARKMLEGIDGKNIFISEYVKYSGMYAKFTTLFSYESNPLIFAGTNAMGNREVVVGFDLHKADFSLSVDYVPLIGSLLAYSCPDVLDRTSYSSGEDVNVNVTANVINVKAISPDGEEIYVDSSTDIGVLHLDKVGTYTVRVTTHDAVKEYKLYSATPEEESAPTSEESAYSLVGEQEFLKTDGEYDPLVILFVCLALVFCADWMVYCYEKYQLR
jgi:hypothetical protein